MEQPMKEMKAIKAMKEMKMPKVKKEKSTKTRMTNSWVDFLKDYAKSNNITYSCALSDPRAKDEYKEGKMTTKDYSKPVIERVMKPVIPTPKKKTRKKILKNRI